MKNITRITLFAILIACEPVEKTNSLENKANYITTDYVTFSVDSLTSVQLITPDIINYNSEQCLIFGNYLDNTLQIYDWDSKQRINRIQFEKEGPTGINNLEGFKYINQDSILVFSSKRGTLFWFDEKGNLLDTIKHNQAISHRLIAHASLPVIYDEGYLYISNLGLPLLYNNSAKGYWKNRPQKLEYSVEVGNKKHFEYNVDYPPVIKNSEGIILMHNFSRVFNGKEFVYGWHKDENLYLMHKDSLSIHDFFTVKSKYVEKTFNESFLGDIDENEKLNRFDCLQSLYRNLIYDPYRQVYYRLVLHRFTEDELLSNPNECEDYTRPLSIMEISSDFKLKQELKLPAKTYNPDVFVVSPEGFYLSINNPYNENSNENELQLERINFDEL